MFFQLGCMLDWYWYPFTQKCVYTCFLNLCASCIILEPLCRRSIAIEKYMAQSLLKYSFIWTLHQPNFFAYRQAIYFDPKRYPKQPGDVLKKLHMITPPSHISNNTSQPREDRNFVTGTSAGSLQPGARGSIDPPR